MYIKNNYFYYHYITINIIKGSVGPYNLRTHSVHAACSTETFVGTDGGGGGSLVAGFGPIGTSRNTESSLAGGGGGSLVSGFGPVGTFRSTGKSSVLTLVGGGGGGSLVMGSGPVGTFRSTEKSSVLTLASGGGGGSLVIGLGPIGTFRSTEKPSVLSLANSERREAEAVEEIIAARGERRRRSMGGSATAELLRLAIAIDWKFLCFWVS